MPSLADLAAAIIGRLAGTKIAEIEIRSLDTRVRIKRRMADSAGRNVVARAPETGPAPASADTLEGLQDVLSPIAGVFFGSPSPSEPAFVAKGDEVQIGQVVGLVEAMKVFNEVVSHLAGAVVSVIAQDGADIREGEPIVRVRPHDGAAPHGPLRSV